MRCVWLAFSRTNCLRVRINRAAPGSGRRHEAARIRPCASRSAIHVASLTSVLRPGTFLTCAAFASTSSKLTFRQHVPHRLPVHARRLHRDVRAAVRFQPVAPAPSDPPSSSRTSAPPSSPSLSRTHGPHHLLVHVQTGTARMQHFHASLPQPAAGVGYLDQGTLKIVLQTTWVLGTSGVLEVPRSNSFPGSITPRRRSTSGPATPQPITGFIPRVGALPVRNSFDYLAGFGAEPVRTPKNTTGPAAAWP